MADVLKVVIKVQSIIYVVKTFFCCLRQSFNLRFLVALIQWNVLKLLRIDAVRLLSLIQIFLIKCLVVHPTI